MKRHVRSIHTNEKRRSKLFSKPYPLADRFCFWLAFMCPEPHCSKRFSVSLLLQSHRASRLTSFLFRQRVDNLNQHLRVHSNSTRPRASKEKDPQKKPSTSAEPHDSPSEASPQASASASAQPVPKKRRARKLTEDDDYDYDDGDQDYRP